jgi:LAO/AO transport system kinase
MTQRVPSGSERPGEARSEAPDAKDAKTPGSARAAELAQLVRGGDVRLLARLIRDLDDRRPLARAVLRELWPHTGSAFILGVTGNPGAGKSTVVDSLIAHYRQAGLRVGVVAIDPSSPFSGGAILGDRIRMQRHALDPGVFIRSLASRGHLGGLSRSTGEVVAVLDAAGFDVVLIETVGVGQGEVDVVAQADTKVVVTVPGLGDEVQALKAGILEIADVLVVNKADREGADRTVRDLLVMLDLRPHDGSAPPEAPSGEVEIVRTVALRGEGIPELAAAIQRHRERSVGQAPGRRLRRAQRELREALLDRLSRRVEEQLTKRPELVGEIAARTTDPYRAADALLIDLLR